MTDEELKEVVESLRRDRNDGQHVEAKAARSGMPSSVRETLSAFSNTAGGGVIVLGVSEADGFSATGVEDPGAMQQRLVEIARNEMSPELHPRVTTHDVDGASVVACEVDELAPSEKPCFFRSKGQQNGSFRRVGDQDVRLDNAQIQALLASHEQPRYDAEVVRTAGLGDLDKAALDRFVGRLRLRQPRLFASESDESVLIQSGVITLSDGEPVPTLGGILALGTYPQQFFPQMNISVVEFPSTDQGTSGATRFTENRRIDGSVSAMVLETVAVVSRLMRHGAVIDSVGGRRDHPEYPIEALREAVANALVHRDLSPSSRGTQVQIEVFPDRVEIRNPGGLFGGVTVESLGRTGVSSSRNAHLVRILEDVETDDGRMVVENRASGIRAITESMREAGLVPPEFEDDLSSFSVRYRNTALVDQDTREWLELIGAAELTENQRYALTVMRREGSITNHAYRRDAGIDSRVATDDLGSLVKQGLAVSDGYGRWTRYRLTPTVDPTNASGELSERSSIVLRAIRGEVDRREVEAETGLGVQAAIAELNRLIEAGLIEPTAPPQSRLRKYRRTVRGEQAQLF